MILLILAILNWCFVPGGSILQMIIFLTIFIIAEIQRKKGNSSKAIVGAQIISAALLIIFIVTLILGLIVKFV